MTKRNKKQNGLTVIELMIIVAILGMIAAVAISVITDWGKSATAPEEVRRKALSTVRASDYSEPSVGMTGGRNYTCGGSEYTLSLVARDLRDDLTWLTVCCETEDECRIASVMNTTMAMHFAAASGFKNPKLITAAYASNDDPCSKKEIYAFNFKATEPTKGGVKFTVCCDYVPICTIRH